VPVTGHYDVTVAPAPDGTDLRLGPRIAQTTVPYIARDQQRLGSGARQPRHTGKATKTLYTRGKEGQSRPTRPAAG
jgi:hypothetical protein